MTTRKVLLRLGRRGRLVRVVEAVNHGDPVYVVTWTVGGTRRAKFFPRPREKAEALAFAEGVAEEQTRGEKPQPTAPNRARIPSGMCKQSASGGSRA